MSTKQLSAEYDIGKDVYGKRTTATRSTDYMGRTMWTITTHASSSLDDNTQVRGLTDEQIEDLHRALREQRLQHGK